jgi:predicted secreted protein
MMSSDKYSAFGTVLEMDSDPIANIRGISGPSLSLDTEDVTTHDQATAWEEVVGTILRSGEVTLDIVYDPGDDTHLALLTEYEIKSEAFYGLKFPDADVTTWSFSALVTGFEPDAPVDGALTASVTLKITGEVSLNSGQSS